MVWVQIDPSLMRGLGISWPLAYLLQGEISSTEVASPAAR